MAPLPTTRALIASYGSHVGAQRRCSCCGLLNLYALRWANGLLVLLCSRCDTEGD